MTNFEKIKQMSVDELSILMGFYVWEESCFYKWFNKTKCKNCKNIEVQIYGKTQQWKECEFEGICPLFESEKDIIKLWLESETDNE